MNIEDSRAAGGGLLSVQEQVDRVRAARDAAIDAGLPQFVINVRTDVYLLQIGEPGGRLSDVLTRVAGYAKAGADCLFVPGLLDLKTLRELTSASPLPVNAMAGPGGPSIGELTAVGVRRISVGTAIAQAAYKVADRATRPGRGFPVCRARPATPRPPARPGPRPRPNDPLTWST